MQKVKVTKRQRKTAPRPGGQVDRILQSKFAERLRVAGTNYVGRRPSARDDGEWSEPGIPFVRVD